MSFVEEIVYKADIDDVRRKLEALERHTRDVEDTTRASTDRAGSHWASFGGRTGSVIAGVGSAVAGLATSGALALGGMASAAVGFGLKTAGSMEQAKISFETMLGSADKAGAFLKDLQAFAAKTPFEFPELQTAASSLVSAGFEANKVIPIMRTLGDVTSGMGTGSEGVQRATVALQQMAAAGRITGEDLNQLRDAGVPVFDLLAAATGKSKEEVAALAQAGKLGKDEMNALFKALETGKGLERFNGLMEKQSASLNGMFSTLKDTVSMGLAGAVEPLVPLLSAAIPKAADLSGRAFANVGSFLENFIKQAGNLYDVFRDGDDVANGAAEVIDNMFGNTGALIGPIREVVLIFQDLWAVIRDGIIPVVVNVTNAMPSFLSPLRLARDLLGWMADNAETLQPILAALLVGFMAYKAVAGVIQMVTMAQTALNLVMTANPIGLLVVAIAALVAGLVYAYNHSEAFRTVVQGAWSGIQDAASTAGAVIKGVLDWLVGAIQWAGGVIAAVFEGVRWWFLNMTPLGLLIQHFDTIVGFVASLPGRIRSAASGMWDGIKDAFRTAINWIIRAWNGIQFRIPGFSVGPISYGGFVLGVPDLPYLHGGGIFRAPMGQSEGLAVLKSGERVSTPFQQSMAGSGGVSLTVVVQAGEIVTERELGQVVQEAMAEAFAYGRVDPNFVAAIRTAVA